MNELTEKWEKTGLLDGLNDFQKNECAVILHKAAKIIIKESPKSNTKEYSKHDEFCGWVIPSVRRIYYSLYPEKFPDVDWFMKDAKEFFQNKQGLFQDLKGVALDAEFEFGVFYDADFIKRYESICKNK